MKSDRQAVKRCTELTSSFLNKSYKSVLSKYKSVSEAAEAISKSRVSRDYIRIIEGKIKDKAEDYK